MTDRGAIRGGEGALAACALALAVGLGVVLSSAFQTEARAEMVAQSDHLVALTAKGGNVDVLLVIDNRSERLMVYKVNPLNTMDLVQKVDLPTLFEAARARRTGDQ